MGAEGKKYKVIAKVDNKDFVRYHVNDLVKFTAFLDTQFPKWRWFNVYRYTKEGNGEQLQSFTSKSRPDNKSII
ncbi:hypothetical protein Q0590_35350 [Rhodocytophaga aerolata]|uniref:Uncharacterized protein n=1 Tax=Rhodocytophaga aerolata TaxID=455078 RepID=A0ABT8RJX8_9BACT|nr:hypothetical protein [Rhodocytophaga aerolata]MDO1451603.1 hypothetical protein [Rhodocytophaga aerolata]